MSVGEDAKSAPPATFLYIRYDEADDGNERPIKSGVAYWHSPDIWVTNVDALGNPVGGEPTEVKARIWNVGSLQASPLFVEFWFIAPSLGITTSAPKKIGTARSLGTARSATVVRCPQLWTPPVTDATKLHSCLIATCWAPLQHDLPLKPSTPVSDRHTGQRNLTVMEASAGEQLHLPVALVNLLDHVADVTLVANATWQHTFAQATPRTVDVSRAGAPVEHHAERAVDASELDGLLALTRVASATGEHELAAAHEQAAAAFHPIGRVAGLAARQTATAHFSITVPDEPTSSWLVVNLAQASDGVVDGGYTVAIRVKQA
jgi:hypothetical protein